MHKVASELEGEVDLLRGIAGALLIGAGVFHLLYAPAHFDEATDVGFFFVIVGVDQIAAGLLIAFAAPLIPVMLAALVGTAGVIVMYVASRTTGLPFGPTAGAVEPVGLYDGLTAAMEFLLVLVLSYLLGLYR